MEKSPKNNNNNNNNNKADLRTASRSKRKSLNRAEMGKKIQFGVNCVMIFKQTDNSQTF